MDVSALIASFATGTYTVTRTARGTTVRGRVNAGTTSTLTITASVSPASGNDLLRLPEGRRTTESKLLFTSTLLRAGGQGESFEADKVTIGGEQWEVQQIRTWNDSLTSGVGYECIVQVVR